jgi:hypothetical protein
VTVILLNLYLRKRAGKVTVTVPAEFVMRSGFIVIGIFGMLLIPSACSSGSPMLLWDSQGTYSLETRVGIQDIHTILEIVGGKIVRAGYPSYQSLRDLLTRVNQDASEVIPMTAIR